MPQMAFYCHHEHQNKKWALSLGQNWRTENRKPGARGVRCAVLPQFGFQNYSIETHAGRFGSRRGLQQNKKLELFEESARTCGDS